MPRKAAAAFGMDMATENGLNRGGNGSFPRSLDMESIWVSSEAS